MSDLYHVESQLNLKVTTYCGKRCGVLHACVLRQYVYVVSVLGYLFRYLARSLQQVPSNVLYYVKSRRRPASFRGGPRRADLSKPQPYIIPVTGGFPTAWVWFI